MPLLSITMYDSTTNAPKGLLDWPYHLFQLILNQVKRIWQSTFSEQDIIANCKNFSPENVYYLTPQQLTYLRKIPVDRIVDLRPLAISCYTKTKEKLLNSFTFDQLTRLQLDEIIATKIADQFRPDVKEHLEAIIPIFLNQNHPLSAALLTIELGKQKKLEAFFRKREVFINTYRRFNNCPQEVREIAKKEFCQALTFDQLIALANQTDDAIITSEIVTKFQPNDQIHQENVYDLIIFVNNSDRPVLLVNLLEKKGMFNDYVKNLIPFRQFNLFVSALRFSFYKNGGKEALETIVRYLMSEVNSYLINNPDSVKVIANRMIQECDWENSLNYDQFAFLVGSFNFITLFTMLLVQHLQKNLQTRLCTYIRTNLNRFQSDLKRQFQTVKADQLNKLYSLKELNPFIQLCDQRAKELWFSTHTLSLEIWNLKPFIQRCSPQELTQGAPFLTEHQVDSLADEMERYDEFADFARFFDFTTLHRWICKETQWGKIVLTQHTYFYIWANLERLKPEIETAFEKFDSKQLKGLQSVYGGHDGFDYSRFPQRDERNIVAARTFLAELYKKSVSKLEIVASSM